MNKIWYCRQWDNAPMPHAVSFTRDGHAIHGTLEVKRLGKPASHGCVRLSPKNAATLFALIEKSGREEHAGGVSRQHSGGEGKVQIKPEPNRGTKITTRTPFLSGEDEADFSDVYLVDKSALSGPRLS